VAIEAATKLV
jgi:hypothetical protein